LPDSSARDALIEQHLHLVDAIAANVKRSLPPSFELDDLKGAGYLGLIKAAESYRPEAFNGTPFSAFARHKIRGFILDSVRGKHYKNQTLARIADETTLPTPAAPCDAEGDLDQQREQERLRAAIRALPKRQAQVIELYCSPAAPKDKEVAKILSLHPSYVSKLRVMALKALQEALGKKAA
jgi:RNA polymerase sigma factor (sigma-70 family)